MGSMALERERKEGPSGEEKYRSELRARVERDKSRMRARSTSVVEAVGAARNR